MISFLKVEEMLEEMMKEWMKNFKVTGYNGVTETWNVLQHEVGK